jgi:hypothetical protein
MGVAIAQYVMEVGNVLSVKEKGLKNEKNEDNY